jgi:glucose uptake protein GlcU
MGQGASIPDYVGYIAVAIACLCYGSFFVPVKKFETGDGVFFQWILCCAVLLAGFVVNIVRAFPPFQPLAMLGGFLWCTGNMMAVPIIKTIGLSLGMLLWGLSNEIMGWSTATFGLFGLHAQTTSHPALNYAGAAIAIPAAIVFAFIKPSATNGANGEHKPHHDHEHGMADTPDYDTDSADDRRTRLLQVNGDEEERARLYAELDWTERLTPTKKRVLGIVLSVISGALYGSNFTPPQYIMDNCPECSQVGLDYVFSHFLGIWLTSTLYMVLYAAFRGNSPKLYPRAMLPGFLSGLMWATATICWFIANSSLSLVVTFPILAIMPGIVASLWGIFVFKEITGMRNYILFALALVVMLLSTALVALSKAL